MAVNGTNTTRPGLRPLDLITFPTPIQKMKPKITNDFFSENRQHLEVMLNKIFNDISKLRDYYEDQWTEMFSNEELARMMLLDGCFLLFFIECVVNNYYRQIPNIISLQMNDQQVAFVQQDLFLTENQLPFWVLEVLMESRIQASTTTARKSLVDMINAFVNISIQKILPASFPKTQNTRNQDEDLERGLPSAPVHLLQHLHNMLVGNLHLEKSKYQSFKPYTFRNVNELRGAGIHFKQSSSNNLSDVSYVTGKICAYLELPRITVDDSTESLFLNLISFEMCSGVPKESWVTSYICFLDSLIDDANDVKVLRSAKVLDNCLGSDEEVAQLFNNISKDLVPNASIYANTKTNIQEHYDDIGKKWIAQLQVEYFKTPWSFLALLGAILALFLSGVQAYFGVWPRSK